MKWNPPVELSKREQRLCKRLEKYRRFYRFVRLRRHELFDETFQRALETMYADKPRGTEPVAPALLATVVLLQAYAKVSDEEAVLRAETDACWQMVLDCIGADEAPFSQGTLSNFRARLIEAGMHQTLLRRTYELAKSSKDFGFKQVAALRIAIDSAPLDGAGKVEDTLNLLGRALRLLVVVVAAFLGAKREQVIADSGLSVLMGKSIKAALDLDWRDDEAHNVGLRIIAAQLDSFESYWRAQMPRGLSTRALEDAQARINQIRAQNTEMGPNGQERLSKGVAPDRLISLSDPQMRHGRKSETERIDGYKKYLASDVDNGLVVATGVLPANVPERDGADKLRPEIDSRGKVAELLIDCAFLSSQLCTSVDANGGRVTCRAPRVRNGNLFPKSLFEVDLANATVRCPKNKLAVIRGDRAEFSARDCGACGAREQCKRSGPEKGRVISIGPNEALYQKLAANENMVNGRARLRTRTAIEHALSHHCRRQGRVARYRGVAKNDFDVARIAAVQNLMEIDRREREAQRARVPKAA